VDYLPTFWRNCCVLILPWGWRQQFPPIYWYPPNYTASCLRMSLSWRMDSWDPQIMQSKFITLLTNLSRSSVLQTEFGFFSRFTDAEISSWGIESRWGRDFPHLSRPSLGFTQPHVKLALGSLSRG